MRNLIKPPVLQTGKEQERHATWLELLYDLIFVAAVSQLAATLTNDFTPTGTLQFVFLFIPVWWAWVGHTYYLTRFDTADVSHRFLTMFQMIAVAAMAINIPGAFGITSTAFALSYAAVRAILVLEYVWAGYHIPEARTLTNRYSIGFGGAMLLWVFSVFIPPPLRFMIWAVAIIVDFLTPLTTKNIHVRFAPHQMHLPERFGLFTIIVIGEAVAGVVVVLGKEPISFLPGVVGIMGLVIAFSFWWNYFEGVKGASLRVVSSYENVGRYQIWLYSHLPLLMGITITAVGIRHVIRLSYLAPLQHFQALIFCGAVGVSCIALDCIFLAGYPAKRSHDLHRFLIPHYIVAFLGIVTGLLGDRLPSIVIIAIMMMLCFTQILFAFRKGPA